MEIVIKQNYIYIIFKYPVRVLTSAFFNGGYGRRRAILNLKTSTEELKSKIPDKIVIDSIKILGLPRETSAMLTSAYLDYAQISFYEKDNIKVGSIISAGTSNALNISHLNDASFSGRPIYNPGTINIILFTNMWLTSDCLVSSIISATEAKTAALLDLNIKSSEGSKPATGTGTDSIAIISGKESNIQYAGGHTTFGNLIGKSVYAGVTRSLKKTKTDSSMIGKIINEFDY